MLTRWGFCWSLGSSGRASPVVVGSSIEVLLSEQWRPLQAEWADVSVPWVARICSRSLGNLLSQFSGSSKVSQEGEKVFAALALQNQHHTGFKAEMIIEWTDRKKLFSTVHFILQCAAFCHVRSIVGGGCVDQKVLTLPMILTISSLENAQETCALEFESRTFFVQWYPGMWI